MLHSHIQSSSDPNHWRSLICKVSSFSLPKRSYKWNHTICSLFRLFAFNNMHIRFIHVFAWCDSSFLFITEKYCIMWHFYSLFIHFLIEGHLACFQCLVIIDKTPINIYMQVFCVSTSFKISELHA